MAKSRTVIVTGATAGVGRAVARRFACAGNRVGLIARDAVALEEVRRELAAIGARAVCESCRRRRRRSDVRRRGQSRGQARAGRRLDQRRDGDGVFARGRHDAKRNFGA